MFSYSLKELLYWLAVWCVALCAMVTVIPTPVGRILIAVWFVGTTVLNKAFGYRAGFWYACIVGIIPFLLLPAISGMPNPALSPRHGRLELWMVLFFALVFGSVVWIVACFFDKLYSDPDAI